MTNKLFSEYQLKLFRWWSEYKQRKYSNQRAKRFEEVNGRLILKDGQNKNGRPK